MKFDKEKVLERVKARGEFPSDSEVIEWEKNISDLQVKVRKHVGKFAKVPGEQLTLSFMPTDMTRTSPFFPMSKRDMKDRGYAGLKWETAWSRGRMAGPKLSMYDESILLTLLYLAKTKKSHKFETTQYQLCKILGVAPKKNPYKAILESLFRLRQASFFIEYTTGKGKDKKLISTEIWGFLHKAFRDGKTGKILIHIDPYFLKMYAAGMVTSLDIKFRASLKGDITKAIYRFLQGQSPFITKGKYEIHILKLCSAINLDANNPLYQLRRQIRNGMSELRKQKYLGRRSMLNKKDIVLFWKGEKTTSDAFEPVIKKGVRYVDADPPENEEERPF